MWAGDKRAREDRLRDVQRMVVVIGRGKECSTVEGKKEKK